eukprot:1157302-Pelagomonas_calceolata.AAC.23
MPWRPYFHGASHKQTGKEENREEARCSGRGCSVHNNTRQYTHMCTHARTSKQASKQAMCSLPFTEVGGAHADDRRLQCSEQNYQFPSHAPMALVLMQWALLVVIMHFPGNSLNIRQANSIRVSYMFFHVFPAKMEVENDEAGLANPT